MPELLAAFRQALLSRNLLVLWPAFSVLAIMEGPLGTNLTLSPLERLLFWPLIVAVAMASDLLLRLILRQVLGLRRYVTEAPVLAISLALIMAPPYQILFGWLADGHLVLHPTIFEVACYILLTSVISTTVRYGLGFEELSVTLASASKEAAPQAGPDTAPAPRARWRVIGTGGLQEAGVPFVPGVIQVIRTRPLPVPPAASTTPTASAGAGEVVAANPVPAAALDAVSASAPASEPVLARICERLPEELRAPLYRLQGRDHYVEVVTCKGAINVLMRFADAMAEVEDVPGLRVHRSHWVADLGVRTGRNLGAKGLLVTKDGAEVPVSRPYLHDAMDRGWIKGRAGVRSAPREAPCEAR